MDCCNVDCEIEPKTHTDRDLDKAFIFGITLGLSVGVLGGSVVTVIMFSLFN